MNDGWDDQLLQTCPIHITVPTLPSDMGDGRGKSCPDNWSKYRMEVKDLDMHADQVIHLEEHP